MGWSLLPDSLRLFFSIISGEENNKNTQPSLHAALNRQLGVTNIGLFALLLDYLTPSSWSTSGSTHVTKAAVSSVLHDSNAVGVEQPVVARGRGRRSKTHHSLPRTKMT